MEIRRINNGKIFSFGNEVIPKYSFNAKELDEETGMYYFEARYYRAPTFTSRDPLFEKYFWMSPYAYCANNPVKYVDPTGMTVEITGEEQKAAFKEFKKGAAQYEIKIKMDKHGQISGKYVGKGEISKEGQQIMNAITDKSVQVRINATSGNETEGGHPFFGGAFLGNEFSADEYKVTTKQDVNPYDLRAMSEYSGKPGQDILHEITESYEGGLLALKLGKSIGNSIIDNLNYNIAHTKAIPQTVIPTEIKLYDNRRLNIPQVGVRWVVGSYQKDWIAHSYR